MTAKELVRRHYPHSGAQLSAMWGWQIVDYGEDGRGDTVLGRARRSESDAWCSADKRIRRVSTSTASKEKA